MGDDAEFLNHLKHLSFATQEERLEETVNAPLFTKTVQGHAEKLKKKPFPQYALLAGRVDRLVGNPTATAENDPRIFHNIAAPWSAFICGSQGSGKSHTLSCLLENCLVPSGVSKLPHPLAGIVFNYDNLIGENGGSPCEAAFLASSKAIKVQVLCSPSNMRSMANTYAGIPGVQIQALKLSESNLNTSRMFSLMGAGATGGSLPLYFSVLQKILREMRIDQQARGTHFSYDEFKRRLRTENLTDMQLVPLHQRLDCLESFMVSKSAIITPQNQATSSNNNNKTQAQPEKNKEKKKQKWTKNNESGKGNKKKTKDVAVAVSATHSTNKENGGAAPASSDQDQEYDWTPKPGHLTIIDLSCPCVTSDMACSLFAVCLSLFLEAKPPQQQQQQHHPAFSSPTQIGRVVALDEAHKYLGASSDTNSNNQGGGGSSGSSSNGGGRAALTSALLDVVRLQRHLGTRVIVATQEPTVSPRLLDLCSVALVHRFGSPEWMRALKGRLVGASGTTTTTSATTPTTFTGGRGVGTEEGEGGQGEEEEEEAKGIFERIVGLGVGEALLFAPGMAVGVEEKEKGKKGGVAVGVGMEVKKLGAEVLTVRVRKRVTVDGGKSIMAG